MAVLLTGASRGIGFAIAQALLAAGYHQLALNSLHPERLLPALEKLKVQSPQAQITPYPADLANPEQVDSMVNTVLQDFGHVSVLINNAAIATRFALLQEVPFEDYSRLLDVNLKGPLQLMHRLIPQMVSKGGGTIININSVAGKKAYPYSSVYCASKFALHALTQSLVEEQRCNDIRAISIHPGEVNTEMWQDLEPGVVQNPETMLTPEAVANAVIFALSQPAGTLIREITLVPQKPED